MAALVSPNSGDIIQASHITQLTGLVAGTSGKGQVVVLTDVGSSAWNTANSGSDASTLWALTVRNQGTGGQAFRVQDSAGTTIASAKDSLVSLGVSPRNLAVDTASSPSGPRAYIVDASNGKAVMTLTRGDPNAVGASIPSADSTYTMAMAVSSYVGSAGSGTESEAIKATNAIMKGTGGFHTGIWGIASIPSGSTWTPGGLHGITGVSGTALGYVDSARLWGAGFTARTLAGTSTTLVGVEIDVGADTACDYRYGLQIVTLSGSDNSGSVEDVAFKIADKNNPTIQANLWDYGIGFGSPAMDSPATSVGFPVKTTGTLIRAFGNATIANGIDLSSISISGQAFKAPAASISGLGRLTLMSATPGVSAPLKMNCSGEAYTMQIDNPVTNGSAGGGTAKHLKIVINGVAHTITANAI